MPILLAAAHRFGYSIAYPNASSAGLPAWKTVSSPGIELLSLTDAGGGVTQATWAVTYLPAAGPVSPGISPSSQISTWITKLKEPAGGAAFSLVLPNLGVVTCSSNHLFCNAVLYVTALACPTISTALWGAAAPIAAPGGQYPLATLVCVTNCGVLPWRLAVTYAAVTGNATALYAPRQVPIRASVVLARSLTGTLTLICHIPNSTCGPVFVTKTSWKV